MASSKSSKIPTSSQESTIFDEMTGLQSLQGLSLGREQILGQSNFQNMLLWQMDQLNTQLGFVKAIQPLLTTRVRDGIEFRHG
ncbi:hypothetical protein LP7551_04879 [Roseibium album]|nr:hypothetical protein LP7551_04879 [Roseibium album]